MSLNISGEKCAVCSAYLFPEDDIVYCPECGAPHHRDCYNSIGHCGLEHFHGTENQYKKPEIHKADDEQKTDNTVTCGMCGEKYDNNEIACPSCNAPNMTRFGGRVVTIDLTGGIPDDTDIGEGVKVKDAKQFVAVNTHRYMPKFAAFNKGKKTSWNWLGFLTPCGWLLSRKMYLLGAIIGALQIAVTMFRVPFVSAVNMLDTSEIKNYMELSNLIFENISMIGDVALLSAFIGSILEIILRVIIAVFGDRIYRNRVISKVIEINHKSEDKAEDFRKKGGVGIFAGVLGYLAVSELPTIIAYTLGML